MEFAVNPFPYGRIAEEVLSDTEYNEFQGKLSGMAERYPVLNKWMDEANKGGFFRRFAEEHPQLGMTAEEILTKGAASVVALVQTAVIDNTFPLLIGRQVSTVVPIEVGTAGTSVTFYRRKSAVPTVQAGVGATMRKGAGYDTQNISVTEIVEETMEWDRSFVEDVPFAVALDGSKEVARIVAVRETSKILGAIDGIAGAAFGAPNTEGLPTASTSPSSKAHNSAGTANTSTTGDANGGPWFDLATAVSVIEGDDGMADFLALHSKEILGLWLSQHFIHQFIFGDQFDVRTGVLGESYLGFRAVKSSLMPTVTNVWLGNSFYVKDPIKRELLTEPYENPALALFGYKASERLGSGVIFRYPSGSTNNANTLAQAIDFYKLTSGGWIA